MRGIVGLMRGSSRSNNNTSKGKDSSVSSGQLLRAIQDHLERYELSAARKVLNTAKRSIQPSSTASTMEDLQKRFELEIVYGIKGGDGAHAVKEATRLMDLFPVWVDDPTGAANLGIVFAVNKQHHRAIDIFYSIPMTHSVWKEQVACWLAESLAVVGRKSEALSVISKACDDTSGITPAGATASGAARTDPSLKDRSGHITLHIKNLRMKASILAAMDHHEAAADVVWEAYKLSKVELGDASFITSQVGCLLGTICCQGQGNTKPDCDALAVFDRSVATLIVCHREHGAAAGTEEVLIKSVQLLAEAQLQQGTDAPKAIATGEMALQLARGVGEVKEIVASVESWFLQLTVRAAKL